jgi:anthranilate phosphoribosyltransferase
MKETITHLIDYNSLTRERAREVLMELASGNCNPSQAASFMTVYMMRSITIEELEGFRDAMLELCTPVTFDRPVMDVCGTGGDGKNTFNVSTLASFVVAAAGQPVAKHGNYGVSSSCGSSNVLEYFGYTFTHDIERLKRSLDTANICFMHAPLFHPALKHVAPVRKELGVKTFFNMLGPMVNPSSPDFQLVGVFNLELARKYGYIYQRTNKSFSILHSTDGYDEISLTGPVKIYHNQGENFLQPSDFGMRVQAPAQILGGNSIKESAAIFLNVLEGNGTEQQNNAVIANAAMALFTTNRKAGLKASVEKAREALASGKALHHFKTFLKH